MIPVDFRATTPAEVKAQAYSASRLARELGAAGADSVIVVVDACRDNPFKTSRAAGSTRSLADSPGLAAMPVDELSSSPTQTPSGMLIQFATGSGRTADDTPKVGNSLFAGQLLAVLDQPGLTVEQVFSLVRQRVSDATRRRQVPLTMSTLVRTVYFVPPKPVITELAPHDDDQHLAKSDDELWESVGRCNSIECHELYRSLFPAGLHAEEAGAAIAALKARGAGAVAAANENQARLRSVIDRYAKSFSDRDVRAVKRIFPRLPDSQKNSIADKKACRSNVLRIESSTVLRDEPDAAWIKAETIYDCKPQTSQENVIHRMSEIFALRRAPEGWMIDSIASVDQR